MAVVLEVGPATVRTVGGAAGDRVTAAAALDGIDDPVVLLGERPVAVAAVWRTLLTSLLRPGSAASVVVVYPSWWPQRRLSVVVDALDAVKSAPGGPRVGAVVTVARRDLIVAEGGPDVVIEIGSGIVAVSNGAELVTCARTDVSGIARAVAGWTDQDSGAVRIDASEELPGAAEAATAISKALWASRITARRVDVAALALSAAARLTAGRPRRPLGLLRGWLVPVALAGLMAAVIIGFVAARPHAMAPVPPPEATDRRASLVEGRVAVDVPVGWTVQRVTGGPGSRRVVVSSPTDPESALHITQTYAPGSDLAQAAEVLARAVGAQPPGVFVDFRATDDAVGRAAVTYREVRPGKVVRWSVVLAGVTRISIGCQSAVGHEDSVREACDDAVRSARELGLVTQTVPEPEQRVNGVERDVATAGRNGAIGAG